MLLQLTGSLEPGETYATIDLDAASILPKNSSVILELVNVIICKQEGHSHFDPVPVAAYPDDPERYPESITVRQSRPKPLTFRRRTTLHVPHLDPPSVEPTEREEQARNRRALVPHEEEAAGEEELGDMDFVYEAVFRLPIFEFGVQNFPELSLDLLINSVLQSRQSPAVHSHFQRLLPFAPVYELVDDHEEDRRQRKKKVRVTLPPLTRLMCGDREFFDYLGMHDVAVKIDDTDFYGLVNESSTIPRVFLSTESQPTALKFSFYSRANRPPDSFDLLFQRLNPFVSSKVSLKKICNKNSLATSRLFQMTLNCVTEALDLPENSLRVYLLDDETTVEFDKETRLLHAEDSTDNFRVSFKFGLRLADLLGLNRDDFLWILSPRHPGQLKLTQALVPEDPDVCTEIMKEVKEDFFDQKSDHPEVQKWKKSYDERKAAAAVEEEEGNLPPPAQQPFDVGGEEFQFEIEPRRLDDDDDDDFDLVQIPNPHPRPPTSFTVANAKPKHICTPTNVFPDYYTLILKEGEPLDYLTKVRGHGSVLGLVRKMQPNIVSNTCVLKNAQALKSLSVEFADESLNTIRAAPGSQAVWIKLDLKCQSGQQY